MSGKPPSVILRLTIALIAMPLPFSPGAAEPAAPPADPPPSSEGPASKAAAPSVGFHEGKLLFGMSGGGGGAKVDHVALYRSRGEPVFEYRTVVLSDNPARRLVALIKILNQPEPRVISEAGRFEMEYALTDWLGVGISYNATRVTLRSVRAYSEFSILALMRSPPRSALDVDSNPSLQNYLDLQTTTIRLHSRRSVDAEVRFHLASRSWDLYLGIGIGLGIQDPNLPPSPGGAAVGQTNRGGAFVGLRRFFGAMAVGIEAYGYVHDSGPKGIAEFGLERLRSEYGARLLFVFGIDTR